MNPRVITLGIETGVGQGSVAVLVNGIVTVSTQGQPVAPSRAENLLVVIKDVLESAAVVPSEIDLIAVSGGPGSYSGIRIGWSTGLGLAASAGARCVGVPLLNAIALAAAPSEKFIVALPVGKRDVAWQLFEAGSWTNCGAIRHGLPNDLIEFCKGFDGKIVVTELNLINTLEAEGIEPQIVRFDEATGAAVARFAETNREDCLDQPLYIRDHLAATMPT